MATTVISYPIPPYSNVPINTSYYQPRAFVITALSLGSQTTVTTSVNHNYVIGQLCRLLIPNTYGSRELNEKVGYVVSIPALNQVVLNIDSSKASAFTTGISTTKPQILAVGDVNTGLISSTGRTQATTAIPGSFVNISP